MTIGIDAARLRLALFTDTALPQLNGVTRTLDRLARAVRARGGEVRTFTTTARGADDDLSVRRFASIPFWAYPQLRLAAPRVAAVTRELREFRPTLVHAATPFGVGLAGRAAAARIGVPFVSSYHTSFSAYAEFYGLGALTSAGWRFQRWFHNGGLRTFCPTRAVQRELESHGVRRTRVWGRGVDTARFSPRQRSTSFRRDVLGAGSGTVVVGYVGRLAAEKGLGLALDAMRLARQRSAVPIVFAFAGDGPYAAECRTRAPEGSIFLGRLEGEALTTFYASVDMFVFPSRTDTFGNVLLEAMASGLPVVAANAAPTRELLRDGSCGVLADAEEGPGPMAEAIVALAHDAERRAALTGRGLSVAAQHSWDAVFDLLLADYAEVTGFPVPVSAPRGYGGASTWLAPARRGM
jgi:phosphatidylinositol alpha 1,6-mannosyltransferase